MNILSKAVSDEVRRIAKEEIMEFFNQKLSHNKKRKTDTKTYLLSLVKKLFSKLTYEDIQNLQDISFCKSELKLSFPLLLSAQKMTKTLKLRYYTKKDWINGKYYVCNHWYKEGAQENISLLERYAAGKGVCL